MATQRQPHPDDRITVTYNGHGLGFNAETGCPIIQTPDAVVHTTLYELPLIVGGYMVLSAFFGELEEGYYSLTRLRRQ
jgi:hypothetical protein